jgi:uncharacterized protein
LDAKLTQHQRDSGQQFAVLIIPSANGDVIEDIAVRTFEKWQLGRKGKDDGLLIVVAVQDHRVKIEVGDGLEGDITDALSGRVIRNVMAPAFRDNDYAGGLDRALDVLMTAAAGKAPVLPDEVHQRRRYVPPVWGLWLFLWLIITFLRASSRRRGGGWLAGAIIGDMIGSRGGWGSGGQGGGFSGGGGGRSSGGGATGSW